MSEKLRVCKDCGATLRTLLGKGRPPVRCKACADKQTKVKRTAWSKEYAKTYEGYEQTCKRCGLKFKNQSYRAHCSEVCNTAYLEERKRKATCKKCGVEFRPKNPRHWQYCSRACSYADITSWYRVSTKTEGARYSDVRFRKCVVCAAEFTTHTKAQLSCAACADKLANHNITRAKRPAKIHITRAKNFGVPYEKFDPVLVFERAGWMCQICGIPTPMSKRGTYDDDAPELDHITSLSKGGSHTLDNSQCACKRCNRHKSDTV